jgi:hypothetical protein
MSWLSIRKYFGKKVLKFGKKKDYKTCKKVNSSSKITSYVIHEFNDIFNYKKFFNVR